MDREKAVTELLDAVADVKAQPQRINRLAVALYEADKAGIRQKRLIELTGFTRETIRRHIEDEQIRRGEKDPTARYLRAQERAVRRMADES